MGSSDLYKIYTSRENYFVRLNRAGTRSQANIDAEIDFLKFCNFNGVLVSTPICDIEGVIVQQTQTPEGAQPATIFPEIAGNSILKQLPKQLKTSDGKWPFLRDYESIVALSESENSALPLLHQMQRIWMKASVANDL